MASYFDEHDCKPLNPGEQPNHLLHLARLMIDGGYAREWEIDFQNMFGGEKPPPAASKDAIKNLETRNVTAQELAHDAKCPICLLPYEDAESIKEMPCVHNFHPTCITTWLQKTNTCPVCRHELPTDDKDYEELKKQKARQKQREYELESLHGSMYG